MTNIVLVHGYPLDATAFSGVVPLIDPQHTVLVPDLAGFGAEPWPSDGDLSMARQAKHVLDRMDEAGMDTACVVGLSMGGYVALAMVAAHPGRISALGLIGSKPDPDTPDAKDGRDRQANTVVEQGASALVEPMTKALVAGDATLEVRARLRTMIERTRIETYVSALAGMRDRPDTSSVLAGFRGPFATMVGSSDPLVSIERNEEIASLASNGVALVADGSGHLVPMERPAAVAEFIDELVARL